jgi:hypothetical protein
MKNPVRTDVRVIFSHSSKSEAPGKSLIVKRIHRGLEWDGNQLQLTSLDRDCAQPWIRQEKFGLRIVRSR